MYFYRTLTPIKVISFDLDDTLYDNGPVIAAAERAFLAMLSEKSALSQLDADYWASWKQLVSQRDAQLCEDVVQWRVVAMRSLLNHHGISGVQAQQIIVDCMAEFVVWRHKVAADKQTVQALDQLAKRFPLAAISNGNLVPHHINLPHFCLYLRGGQHGRAKPHADLFWQTAAHFHVQPSEILHVGDSLTTDVAGAINAGCQAAWLCHTSGDILHTPEARILPTVVISHISALTQLL
ncbi:HAD hydrolase-like protein [Pasteurellaceae bacterium HPA106]|uniref:HAD family hydrolase n=1 Tax=Spirabiliibacterium pneumoniae TaxID=221400 RepID=UPI001AAE0321|nr:HAD family hydrolase [Spirabiliibacterium pneumoniae]MBE2895767.1 HAD hydrolase-like protein [Spirabiliibacterium pneumoniae]